MKLYAHTLTMPLLLPLRILLPLLLLLLLPCTSIANAKPKAPNSLDKCSESLSHFEDKRPSPPSPSILDRLSAIEDSINNRLHQVYFTPSPTNSDNLLVNELTNLQKSFNELFDEVNSNQFTKQQELRCAEIEAKLASLLQSDKARPVAAIPDNTVGINSFFAGMLGRDVYANSSPTSRMYHGQKIYVISKRVGNFKRGDYFYLDGLHKDHIEVFNKVGKIKFILNLDGSINQAKTKKATAQKRRLLLSLFDLKKQISNLMYC